MIKRNFKCLLTVFVILTIVCAITGQVFSADQIKVNINKASVSELTKLKKVGQTYAERIVEYREKNGPFKKPEDIMNVKGIGIKVYEANKNIIVVK